jgi:hypothetical protein
MAEKLVSHNVFFELKDSSGEAVERLISECHTYLKPVPGIVYFSAGRILEEHTRDVNVRNFHVGIHITFLNKAAHDAYQTCEPHNQFVSRNKDNWESARVFDMYADYGG